MSKNFFEILGVSPDATQEDIKQAYRELAGKYHPDKNPGDEGAKQKFHEVLKAYRILSDPKKKATYVFGDTDEFFFGKNRNNVIMARVDEDVAEKIDQLVDAGIFKSRSESAAFLIAEGVKARKELFDKIDEKIKLIQKLKVELKEIISEDLD